MFFCFITDYDYLGNYEKLFAVYSRLLHCNELKVFFCKGGPEWKFIKRVFYFIPSDMTGEQLGKPFCK